MAVRFRPGNHQQRDQVIQALTTLRASASANPTILTLDEVLFLEARSAFSAARESWLKRSAADREAGEVASAADADFNRDLRLFSATVRDEQGRATPRVVSELLGGILPSALLARSRREEVQRTRALLDRLPLRTGLTYDTARADALRATTEALDLAVTAHEEAHRALLSAGATLAEVKQTFDSAYMRLVSAAKAVLDEADFLSIFPRFVQSAGLKEEEGEATAPASAPA